MNWRRSYDGRGGVIGKGFAGYGVVAADPLPAATQTSGTSTAGMSVAQACAFMQSAALESVPLEDKAAFLTQKGVADTVIAGAACVSPLDKFGPVQGHPDEGVVVPVADAAAVAV